VWSKSIGSEVKAVKFSPDGQFIYAAAIGRKPMKLSTETGEILREYEGFNYEADLHFSALDISSDGKWLIGGEYGNNMFIIDTETGSIVKTLTTEYQEIQSNKFNTVTITPDKRYIIATNRFRFDAVTPMNGIVIWDATSGELIKVINSINVIKVKASPDNSHFAVSYYDESQSEIQIYDVGTWEISTSLCCHSSLIQDIAFSPDGSLIASGGSGGEIKIWDIPNQTLRESLTDYGNLTSIAFLNNSTIVCDGNIDFVNRYTKIWNINQKEVIGMIKTNKPWDLDVDLNSNNCVLALTNYV
jgi:DNA-binding beta-propeller fold protein YncE